MAQPAGAGSSVNADLGAKIKTVTSILPIVGNNTTEGTGVGVDLKGYDSAVVLIHVGDSGDTLSGSVYITPTLEDSPDNSVWTAIPASGYRVDVGDLNVIDAPAEDSKVIQVTLLAGLGRQRYVRPLLTFTGTHTNGTPISAVVIKGNPRVLPATH
jgi:hypothetical protein